MTLVSTSKCVLLCLNSLFWTGLVLLCLLLFIHHEKELDIPISYLASFSLPFDTNMIVLAVLFATGFIGYLAILFNEAKRKMIIAVFSSLLILLTCLLGLVAFLEFWHHDEIRKDYLDQFDDSILGYNSSSNAPDWVNDGAIYSSDDVDRIQTYFHCCGSKNYTDFGESPWGAQFPKMAPYSCCDPAAMERLNQTCRMINYETERDLIFTQPCYEIVEATFLHWLDTLIVVQAFLAVFTLISLVGSSCWIRSLRRAAIPYQLVDQDDTESIQAQ